MVLVVLLIAKYLLLAMVFMDYNIIYQISGNCLSQIKKCFLSMPFVFHNLLSYCGVGADKLSFHKL